MSTRAQIKYKDSEFDIHVYKHSDGYPDGPHGVLKTLVPFVEQFKTQRGLSDEAYFLAQLIRRFAIQAYKEEQAETDERLSLKNSPYGAEGFFGWGLDCVKHGDTEYLYEIDKEGAIYINGKKQTAAMLKKALKDD